MVDAVEGRSGPLGASPWFAGAALLQLASMLVLVFGDIGFDKPGRFGLDFEHALWLGVVWLAAAGLGVVLACRMRRPGPAAIQGVLILLALGFWLLA